VDVAAVQADDQRQVRPGQLGPVGGAAGDEGRPFVAEFLEISGRRKALFTSGSSAVAALTIASLIGLASCAQRPDTPVMSPVTEATVSEALSTVSEAQSPVTEATVTGRALTLTAAGQPVSDVTIEFKNALPCAADVCYQPHTTTDSTGTYTINLDDGVYNALCDVSNNNSHDECGPRGGDGGPFPVQVPPSNQNLDFIVCPLADYPACLSQN